MFANIFKYILGIFLAIAILAGGGVAAALYFMNQTSLNPPKPIYDNDTAQVKAQVAKSQIKGIKSSPNSIAENKVEPPITPAAKSLPSPSPSPKALPPGAYVARVTWSSGLTLRTSPNQDAESLGGIAFNQKIIVLQQSDDKAWEKIRLKDSNEEGWIKAGNTEKVDDSQQTDSNQDSQTKQTDSNQDSQLHKRVKRINRKDLQIPKKTKRVDKQPTDTFN